MFKPAPGTACPLYRVLSSGLKFDSSFDMQPAIITTLHVPVWNHRLGAYHNILTPWVQGPTAEVLFQVRISRPCFVSCLQSAYA